MFAADAARVTTALPYSAATLAELVRVIFVGPHLMTFFE